MPGDGYYRKNKYNNVKTVVDGITFDSKAEARRYQELKLMQLDGKIVGFGRQPSFELSPGVRYRPDFIVCSRKGIWVEDVKGYETPEFKIKEKLWEAKYPWIKLVVVK